MQKPHNNSVLKTLAFFDVANIPVRMADVRRWYWGDDVADKRDLMAVIDWHASQGFLQPSREEASIDLINRSHRWLRVLAMWPGVQALYLCNSAAFMSVTAESDVDVFVVCKKGSVWSTRFVLTALLALFGKRPKPGQEAGTICLSFFIDETTLDLSSVALAGEKDIYLAYWLATLAPVYDPADTEILLLNQNKPLFPNETISTLRRIREAKVEGGGISTARALLWPAYWIVRFIQPLLKHWQQQRFPVAIVEASKANDHRVVMSDTMLKFHTNDRREHYKQAWQKRYETLEARWRETMS